MKKIKCNNFLFGVLFTISIILVAKSFQYATAFRVGQGISGDSIGGEVFTIALPLLLVWQKLKAEQRAYQSLKNELKQSRKQELSR